MKVFSVQKGGLGINMRYRSKTEKKFTDAKLILCLLILQYHVTSEAKTFNRVAIGKKPTEEPYYSIQFQHGKQRCFSICTYSQSCITFLIEENSDTDIICQFYNKTAELLNVVDNPSTTAVSSVLYSVIQRYRSCLEWYTLAGGRKNGTYEIVDENNQLVDKQCKLELESCVDVYNLGFRTNGIYKVKENNQLVDKQCKLELESCLDVYKLGFQTNGIYKVKENNQLVDKQCKLELESCHDSYNLGFRINGIYKVKENNQLVDKQCKLELESCFDVYNLGFRTDGIYKVKETTNWLTNNANWNWNHALMYTTSVFEPMEYTK